MKKIKKKSRQSIFIPQIHDISLSEWKSLIKAFTENYPQIEGNMSLAEKSWEYLLCTFFVLLSEGVLGANAPIVGFYSLLLSSFNPDKGFLRINDKKTANEKNKFKGRKVYPSALATIHLLSYCLHIVKEIPNEWGQQHDRLVPQSFFPQAEFQKRFRAWILRMCNYAGIQKVPSMRAIINLARINLIVNHPSFVVGLLVGNIQYSPMPDTPAGKRAAFFGETAECPTNRIVSPSCEKPPVIDNAFLGRIDLNYSKVCDYLGTFSMRPTNKEKEEIACRIDTLLNEDRPLFMKQPDASIDGTNLLLVADWLKAMLSYPKLAVNTVRTYFAQVSAVLRTELLGEKLNGLNQVDMETILENCATGNSARVLKAALKSFLRYISKVHKIETGPISWGALSVESCMKDKQILWPSDVAKILAATDDPQIRQAIRLGFCCGMRISEIAYLNPRNIDMRGEAFIDIKITKSKAGKRRLPVYLLMNEKEIEEFTSFYDAARKKEPCSEVLFVTAKGLPFYNPQVLSMAAERVIARAGYAWASFHTLRHSFASILLLRWFRSFVCPNLTDYPWQEMQIYDGNQDKDLLANGIYSIGALLGHADVRTTVANYIHTADLLQKSYRDLYERDNPMYLSYGQAINLTGYSQAGLYRKFPPANNRQSGIKAIELIGLQLKKWMKLAISTLEKTDGCSAND